jgi:hypothetical protein
MTAQIGADGLDLFGAPHPELLADVVRLRPESGGQWVDIEDRADRPGFRSTQRLWISDVAEGVAVATWPAEKGVQARYLYGRGLGSALVTSATKRGWKVEPSPHIAFFNSHSSSRLYMTCPSIAPLEYVAASWTRSRSSSQDGGRIPSVGALSAHSMACAVILCQLSFHSRWFVHASGSRKRSRPTILRTSSIS